MDNKNILSLIKKGESQNLEFKSTFQKEVIETIVAFANTSGGKIIIGINSEAIIKGVQIKTETLSEWINQVKINTQPNIIPDIEEFEVKNKKIAVITIAEHQGKPIE